MTAVDGAGDRREFHVGMVWNLGSLVVLGLSGIVTQVLIARWSGAEALGVFNQLFAVYFVASQLAVLGVHYSVLQAISWASDDRETCSAITVSALLLTFVTSSLIAASVWLAAPWIGRLVDSPEVAAGLPWIAPGLILFSLDKVLLNALNGVSFMRAFAIFQSLRFLGILGGVAVVCLQGLPSHLLGASLTGAELLLLPGLLWILHRRAFSLRPSAVSGEWLRRHLSFGGRGFLAGSLTELNVRVDVLVLALFVADREVGVYSFAAILAEGFGQIGYIVRRSVDPKLGEAIAAGEPSRIEALSREVGRWLFPAMIAVGLAAAYLYQPVAWRIVDPAVFGASTAVFVILIGGVVFNAPRRAFSGILLQAGRPGAHTILLATLVITNLSLNVLWVPRFGIYGAAAATMVVLVLEAILIQLAARRLLDVRL